jgi:hypothetical protein
MRCRSWLVPLALADDYPKTAKYRGRSQSPLGTAPLPC